MNKKILLILLISAPVYGNIQTKDCLFRRIIKCLFPCFIKDPKTESIKNTSPVDDGSLSPEYLYKITITSFAPHKQLHTIKQELEMEDPIAESKSRALKTFKLEKRDRLSEEEAVKDVMEEKKDRNKLYVPDDSKD